MKATEKKECVWYQVCPIKRYTDLGALDGRWVERYCLGDWRRCVRYRMESANEPHPDWMLPDGSIDESLRRA